MKKDTVWFRPSTDEPSIFWRLFSGLSCLIGIAFGKLWLGYLNDTTIEGCELLESAVRERTPGQPLITISNHRSFADWLILAKTVRWRYLCNPIRCIPWQPGAQELTYRSFLTSLVFSGVRAVPIVRGDGVHQRAMDFLVDALNKGHWVHLYPEGRLNRTRTSTLIKFKSGIGRLIDECDQLPVILPYYHLGMDNVMPIKKPYYPRTGQCVTVLYGTPLDIQSKLQDIKRRDICKEMVYQLITDELEKHMEILSTRAQELHNRHRAVTMATQG